jgi:mRNA interferase MazF
MAYAPDRGDIVLIDLSPQAGTEMRGEHRAIVLSERDFKCRNGMGGGPPDHDENQGIAT